jgi:hypothetical protein
LAAASGPTITGRGGGSEKHFHFYCSLSLSLFKKIVVLELAKNSNSDGTAVFLLKRPSKQETPLAYVSIIFF